MDNLYKIFLITETHFQVVIYTYLAEITSQMCFAEK